MIKSWSQGSGAGHREERVGMGITLSVPLAQPPLPPVAGTPARRGLPERKARPGAPPKRPEHRDAESPGLEAEAAPPTAGNPVKSCPRSWLLGIRIYVVLPHKRFTDEIKAL